MPSLAARIQEDLVLALKAGDKRKLQTLRGLSSDLKYRRIEQGDELSEEDVVTVLRRAAKKRRESEDAFRRGNRTDLVEIETAERAIIESYLPPELTDANLDELIREAISGVGAVGPAQLGKVMSLVMSEVKGQADGKRVRTRVQALLQD